MILTLLRWALLVGFVAQLIGIVYGVIVLSRIKREQSQLTMVLETFSKRSDKIANALERIMNVDQVTK